VVESGDNGSATLVVNYKGSSSRQGGMERCGQTCHQGTSASRWNKVTRGHPSKTS